MSGPINLAELQRVVDHLRKRRQACTERLGEPCPACGRNRLFHMTDGTLECDVCGNSCTYEHALADIRRRADVAEDMLARRAKAERALLQQVDVDSGLRTGGLHEFVDAIRGWAAALKDGPVPHTARRVSTIGADPRCHYPSVAAWLDDASGRAELGLLAMPPPPDDPLYPPKPAKDVPAGWLVLSQAELDARADERGVRIDGDLRVSDLELRIGPSCHSGPRGCSVQYFPGYGLLRIACAECDKPVVQVAVAPGPIAVRAEAKS